MTSAGFGGLLYCQLTSMKLQGVCSAIATPMPALYSLRDKGILLPVQSAQEQVEAQLETELRDDRD